MTDVFSKKKRSEIMSHVRNRDTRPELVLRKALYQAGIRGYRVRTTVKGHPDIVFPRSRVAIFVDGCFWHGCTRCRNIPSTNLQFWQRKIQANRERDKFINQTLQNQGWTVLRFWEHDIKDDLPECIDKVRKALQ